MTTIQQNNYNKLFGIITFVYILTLFSYNNGPLWEQDEAAYAGFSSTMNLTGNRIIPEFPFSEPHRKPPLHFWVISFFFRIFGISEISLRISSVLAILGTIFITYRIAKVQLGHKTALIAAMVFATFFYISVNAKVALVDATLLFFESLSIYGIYLTYQNRNLFYASLVYFAGIAGGLLVKGPPVLILALGVITGLLLFRIEVKRMLVLVAITPLTLFPLFTWGYLAWQETDGKLIKWMIDWYVLRRAANPVFGQSGPPGYYIAISFLALFPWSFLIPKTIHSIWSKIKHMFHWFKNGVPTEEKNSLFLLLWVFSGWLFYEIVMSKLPSYVLGAYPAIAILIAIELRNIFDSTRENKVKYSLIILPIITTILSMFFIYLIFTNHMPFFFYIVPPVLIIVSIYLTQQFKSKNEKVILYTATFGIAILSFFWLVIAPRLEFRYGPKDAALTISQEYPKSDSVIFNKDIRIPGLAWYLQQFSKKTIIITDHMQLEKEMEAGKKGPYCITYPDAMYYDMKYKLFNKKDFEIFAYDRNETLRFMLFTLK